MTALDWELNWIDEHSEYYTSREHILQVKLNITRRYLANAKHRIEVLESKADERTGKH